MGYQFQQHTFPLAVQEFSLFNSVRFLCRHESDLLQFLILRKTRIVGVIHFNLVDSKAMSPWKASFGGFEFNAELPLSILSRFVTWVVGQVMKKNVSEIQISFPPEFYQMPEGIISLILEECDFLVSQEVGQVILCDKKNFADQINRFERSKLQLCMDKDFNARKGNGQFPEEAFKMILLNRKRKNYPATISYQELIENFRQFPENFHWFGVWKDHEMAAASVGIRVRKDILYHFLPGHDNKFDRCSPMVLLLSEVYRYCRKEEIKYLDLGISSVEGRLNEGLYRFKKNLGAVDYKQLKLKWKAE